MAQTWQGFLQDLFPKKKKMDLDTEVPPSFVLPAPSSWSSLQRDAMAYYIAHHWKDLRFQQTFSGTHKRASLSLYSQFKTGNELDNIFFLEENIYFLFRLEMFGVSGLQSIGLLDICQKLASGEWIETSDKLYPFLYRIQEGREANKCLSV